VNTLLSFAVKPPRLLLQGVFTNWRAQSWKKWSIGNSTSSRKSLVLWYHKQ